MFAPFPRVVGEFGGSPLPGPLSRKEHRPCQGGGVAPGSTRESRRSRTPGSDGREQDPSAQCGDLLLRDRAGNWTYQFAVTVDDREQGVDLVIRGMDLLPSTGRQNPARTPARPRAHAGVLRSPADYEIARSEVEEVFAARATAIMSACRGSASTSPRPTYWRGEVTRLLPSAIRRRPAPER